MKRETILVSKAQKELLELFSEKEVFELYQSLKLIHHLATYSISEQMVDLPSSKSVHELLNAIEKITFEFACSKGIPVFMNLYEN